MTVADEKGNIVVRNRAGREIFSEVSGDALGDWSADHGFYLPGLVTPIPTQDLPLVRAIRGEETDEVELVARSAQTPGGKRIRISGKPLKQSGQLKGGVAIYRDVTELRRAEEQLNRHFTLSLDLFCIAGFDGYFKRLNPAWEKTLGFTNQELLDRPYLELVHPEDREATIREAEKLAGGNPSITFENRYLCKDGSYKWLLWFAAPSMGDKTIFANARDVTDLKIYREKIELHSRELELRNREVERATQLKSQFLANMSHELRTPLNAIIGFSKLLIEPRNGDLSVKQKRFLQHILSGSRHLLDLINDILDLSKIEAGRMELDKEEFLVVQATAEVLSVVKPLGQARQITILECLDASVSVYADRVRFKQVLYNLLSNAVKFTGKDGTVSVTAKVEGGCMQISVADTGIGIQPDDQLVIFEEFRQVGETARGIKEGTGLGLAITRRIVEQHGGRMWVNSELGKGSCFTFTLPTRCDHNTVNADALPVAVVPQSSPAHARPILDGVPSLIELLVPARAASGRLQPLILVVDDDAASRELLVDYLESAGYETMCLSRGVDAIETSRKLHPDAVILDILLPDKNGWEVLRELNENTETRLIPVICVTIVDEKALGLMLGASAYMVKPIEKEGLLAALRGHLPNLKTGTPTVLIVEDDLKTRRLLTELMHLAGYRPLAAGSGAEALSIISKEPADAIILDLLMPEMDGFEVIRRLKASPESSHIPIIVLTGKDLTNQDRRTLKQETNGYFEKSADWSEVLISQMHEVTSNTQAGIRHDKLPL